MEDTEGFKHATTQLAVKLSEAVTERQLDLESIVPIAINLITFVEGLGKLSGLEKKRIVIDVIKDYVSKNTKDPQKADLLAFISLTLPGLIDNIIDLSTGKIQIRVKPAPFIAAFIANLACCSIKKV